MESFVFVLFFSGLFLNVTFASIIPMTNIAMDVLQFIKCFLKALSQFILHQPSDVVCIFITLILHIRLRVMEVT